MSRKNREAVFHFNNRLNIPLYIKEKCTLKCIRNFTEDASFYLKDMGVYFGSLCYGNALNCHSAFLAIPGTRLLFIKKHFFLILFICNCKK